MTQFDLEVLAQTVATLRDTHAPVPDEKTCLPPMAEEFYLLALASLNAAERYATLAKYSAMQNR